MAAAKRVVLMPVRITWAVSITVAQAMSRALALRDRSQLDDLTALASRLGFIPSTAFLVGIVLIGEQAIPFAFGHDLKGCYFPAVLLCSAAAINAKYRPASQLFLLSGGQRVVLWFTLAAIATVVAGIFASAAISRELSNGVVIASGSITAGAIVRDVGLRLALMWRMNAFIESGAAQLRILADDRRVT
jgi:O-antigen/teichoic acid export membrane protein